MRKRLPLQHGRGGARGGASVTQTNGIQGRPKIGNGHDHIREPGTAIGGGTPSRTSLSERGSTGGVDGDISRGQAHKIVNVNEIADTRAATSGRRKNGTGTRILAPVNVTDGNMDDTRAEMTRRTTNVVVRQVVHQIPSKTKIPHLTNAAALHLF